MAGSNRSVALNTFLLGAVLALGVGGIVMLLRSSKPPEPEQSTGQPPLPPLSESDFSFGEFTFDESRLQGEWDDLRQAMDVMELAAAEEQLLESYYTANRQAAAGNLNLSQMAAAGELVALAVSSYLGARGPDAYQSLSWHVLGEFQAALGDARRLAAERDTSLEAVLRAAGPESRTLRERIGDFPAFGREMGLFDQDNNMVGSPALSAIVFRYRWFKFSETYAPLSQLTPYEQVVFLRWRIEHADGIPLTQRLAMVNEAAWVYAGQVELDAVRALVYHRAGEPDQAREHLARAAENNDDPRYAHWLVELEETP